MPVWWSLLSSVVYAPPACACRLPSTSLPAGLRLDYPTFAYLYADIFTPVHSMIAAQQALAAAGVPTYCLSNCSGLRAFCATHCCDPGS